MVVCGPYHPAATGRQAPSRQRAAIISPVVELELAYLHEIGRTTQPPGVVLPELGAAVGLTVSGAPFGAVVGTAVGLAWARDPFDRLIAAQALVENETLLTKDERIRKHLDLAVWDAD